MKTCTSCKESKDLSAFNSKARNRDGLQSHCRECQSKAYKKAYASDSQKYKDATRRYQKEVAKLLQDVKEQTPCADCSVSYPYYVMDFDHLPGALKVDNVADLVKVSKVRALEEVSKCEVVCSNCHRARTMHRQMHPRVLPNEDPTAISLYESIENCKLCKQV